MYVDDKTPYQTALWALFTSCQPWARRRAVGLACYSGVWDE
jgi:hypothetical protein